MSAALLVAVLPANVQMALDLDGRPNGRPAHRGRPAWAAAAAADQVPRCERRDRARRPGRGAAEPDEGVPVALRMSTLFLRTLREDPADAEVPSHRLLVRAATSAGSPRASTPGCRWACRCCATSSAIVREEMDAIGAQELHFPALLPREPYEATGRWTEYGDNIFRLKDRKDGDYLLGPTHEEMFTLAVKDLYSSYKDLPLSLYQIQTKYRDEARPRAGLLRGREFIMKDSYSFDVDDAGLAGVLRRAPRRLHPHLRPARVRLRHRRGHVRRDGRLGVGGVPRPRPRTARTPTCAAPRATTPRTSRPCRCRSRPPCRTTPRPRRARRGHPRHPDDRDAGRPPQRGVPSAGPSVDRRRHAQERPGRARAPGRHRASRWPSALPGDREVDEKRLEAQVDPAEVAAFDEADFAAHPALVKGYIGPGALGEEGAGRRPLPASTPGS